MLEDFLFAATLPEKLHLDDTQTQLGSLHRKMAVKIASERSVRIADSLDPFIFAQTSLAEVERFMNEPHKVGMVWLSEFFEVPEELEEFCIGWTEQCLKQLQTMRRVIAPYR